MTISNCQFRQTDDIENQLISCLFQMTFKDEKMRKDDLFVSNGMSLDDFFLKFMFHFCQE